MSNTGLDVFDRASQRAIGWLDDLQERMDWDNRHRAYEALGIVLHVLRDRLPIEEATDLGAQLPLLIRGLYYQNWEPSVNPERYRRAEDFFARVRERLAAHRMEGVPVLRLVESVADLLADHITEGELSDVRHALPSPIRALFSLEGRADETPPWRQEQRAWDKYSV